MSQETYAVVTVVIMGALSLCIGCDSGNFQDVAVAPSKDPSWEPVRAKMAAVRELLTKTPETIELPVLDIPGHGEVVLPDRIMRELRRESLHRKIRHELINLWVLTGYGVPVTEHPFGELPEHADDVLRKYAAFIDANGHRARNMVVRDHLEHNVQTLNTEYGYTAWCVIQTWVSFNGSANIAGEVYFPVAPERRQEMFERVGRWYYQSKERLTWYPRLEQFGDRTEPMFRLPRLRLLQSDPRLKHSDRE